jgi:transcriptional regulator
MTRRQEITEVLRNGTASLQDIAVILGVNIKAVFEDIPHIEKSVRPQEKLVITPAECRRCGFIFKDRQKIRTPSRCPKCKNVRIKDPVFRIEKR